MKTFVLDTNVILHDPMAMFAFHGSRVVIPMTVVEELFDFGPVPGVNAPSSSETYEPQLPGLGSL